MKREPIIDRFWRHVIKTDGCWRWTSPDDRLGRGRLFLRDEGGKKIKTLASRFSYELHYGPIPSGMLVCHHCDNHSCVRPDHLFLGTHLDNARDREAKGRGAHNNLPGSMPGSKHPNAKLVEADVIAIRERHSSGEPIRSLAATFNIAKVTAWAIATRRTWTHI